MFKKSKKGYYFWEELDTLDGIVHGFSTRKFGDMNWKNQNSIKSLKLFCDKLQIDPSQTVRMEQTHGNSVYWISSKDRNSLINQIDGLLTLEKGVFLVATAADCVPVLFLDKNKSIFGIAHAGWKGVYKEIVKNMLERMTQKGSKRSDIMIGLGPSIRVCCYNVYKDRADVFKTKFSKMNGIIKIKDDKVFLDLIKIIKLQLKSSGILDRNILDSKICTKDTAIDFYSFRKEGGTKSFGLSAGIIGRI